MDTVVVFDGFGRGAADLFPHSIAAMEVFTAPN
jgi:hypothetical protein